LGINNFGEELKITSLLAIYQSVPIDDDENKYL
jgi:hypothetical protein